ncbi:MAG: cadherin-like domain-containing protein [Anaerolineales bacterium]|nr:cadherin-like domain-containing protein [Anaerolineales bacterium]
MPQHGIASWSTGSITYTPNSDYAGADNFTYVISDSQGATATATVTIAAEIFHIYLPVLAAPGMLPFN